MSAARTTAEHNTAEPDRRADHAADRAFERATEWLADGIAAVEERFGDFAAGERPALVAGFMVAASVAYLAELTDRQRDCEGEAP
jgi:glutathione S-transferase